MALQGAQRAATLTSRLLAFSRQQALAPQAVDANKLVAGICDFLRRTLGEAVSLETVLAGGLWRTFADPNQLENAMLNLALNARDAMPDGGKLTIETANCYLDQAYVAALSEPVEPGQYVMIAVADTGTGMDRGDAGARVRSVLHHQGGRQGHRPRPEPGLRLRPPERRPCEDLQRARRRHDGEDLSAAPRRREDDAAEPRRGGATARARSAARRSWWSRTTRALRAYTTEILTELGYRVLEAPRRPKRAAGARRGTTSICCSPTS